MTRKMLSTLIRSIATMSICSVNSDSNTVYGECRSLMSRIQLYQSLFICAQWLSNEGGRKRNLHLSYDVEQYVEGLQKWVGMRETTSSKCGTAALIKMYSDKLYQFSLGLLSSEAERMSHG
ncbi:hypothetical protein GGR56DRAFT_163932 [Xylariaceae sp. FL0804]|nr:hypothetical protein GGR56DRAFT_163932 [Xylariaceae sp. FL0804]